MPGHRILRRNGRIMAAVDTASLEVVWGKSVDVTLFT